MQVNIAAAAAQRDAAGGDIKPGLVLDVAVERQIPRFKAVQQILVGLGADDAVMHVSGIGSHQPESGGTDARSDDATAVEHARTHLDDGRSLSFALRYQRA